MDRMIIYTQEQGRSGDILFGARSTMIGLGKLAQAAFGSNTVVRGLPVTPNSPAALNVLVGLGEIYSLADVDATPWGALPADTTDVIVKQGLNMAAQTISTPAPATSGFSVAYLIECQYQDQDTNAAVLPYYNSSNQQIPLNGQGGNGAPQATQRQGFCVIQAKAGIAAATGTQVTPSVDSGWTALAVVTVANGATTVTSGNISVPAGVPQVTSLLQMMQTGSPVYAVDTSTTANQIALVLTPAITAYTDGQEITFKAANTNTGPCVINAGPGSINLVGAAGALQGAEIVAGSQYTAIYSASLGEMVLNSQTGGAEQVNPATKSQHAMQLGQATGRLLNIQIFTASGTYTPSSPLVTSVIVEAVGGGAGGGGVAVPATGFNTIAQSGGGGAYAKVQITAGFSGATVTIGAAGAAGNTSGTGGTAGGITSFGSIISCPGGIAGNNILTNNAAAVAGQTAQSAAPTISATNTVTLASRRGEGNGFNLIMSVGLLALSGGGNSPFGLGGPTNTLNAAAGSSAGAAGQGFGSGGSGAASASSSAVARAGGAGAPGLVIVFEYA